MSHYLDRKYSFSQEILIDPSTKLFDIQIGPIRCCGVLNRPFRNRDVWVKLEVLLFWNDPII